MQFSTLISLLKVGSWNPGKIFKRGYTPIIPKFLINQNVYVQLKLTIFSVLWVLWENRNRSNRTKTLLEFYFFLGIFFFFFNFCSPPKIRIKHYPEIIGAGRRCTKWVKAATRFLWPLDPHPSTVVSPLHVSGQVDHKPWQLFLPMSPYPAMLHNCLYFTHVVRLRLSER